MSYYLGAELEIFFCSRGRRTRRNPKICREKIILLAGLVTCTLTHTVNQHGTHTHTHTRTDTHTPEDDKAEKGRQMLNQFTAKLTRTRIRAEIVDSSQNLNKQQIKGKCRRQTCSTDFLVGADVARLVHVRPAAIHLVYCVRTARSDCRYTTTLRRQRNMAAARVRTSPCPVETGPCVCVSSCEQQL